MTLLSICQRVANEAGFPTPSTIVGNTDLTAKRLLAAANATGEELALGLIPGGLGQHDWQILRKEQTFNTVNGTAAYTIIGASSIITAGDFVRFVDDTWWDRTNNNPVTIFNPQQWQYVKSGLVSSLTPYFNIVMRGNQILIDPTPSSVCTLVFEYVSNLWCQSVGGTGQTAWAADTDTGRLSEYLIRLGTLWRFLKSIGRAYEEEKLEYQSMVRQAIAQDRPAGIISAGYPTPVYPVANTPDTIPTS